MRVDGALWRTPLRPRASPQQSGSRGCRRAASGELGALLDKYTEVGWTRRSTCSGTGLGLAELAKRYGSRNSRRIWELSHRSVDQLVALLKRLRIRCDLKSRDSVYWATTAHAAERLRRECELRARSGFDAEWLGPGQLRRLTGIAGHGAILSKGNAQFDPYRACIGILRAAAAAGADVFERSEVRRIESAHNRVRIRTRHGTLHADRVIVATGYATSRFRPLAGRFRMYRTYVVATEPIESSVRDDLGLSNVMLWDTDRPYHYARWTPAHRLLLGGGDREVQPGQRRRQQFKTASRDLRTHFETRLPALAAVRTEFAWEGLFAMTADGLSYIGPHRRYPHHWFALGYGGNGMTSGSWRLACCGAMAGSESRVTRCSIRSCAHRR